MIKNIGLFMNHIVPSQCRSCRKYNTEDCECEIEDCECEIEDCECKNYLEIKEMNSP